MRDCNIFRGRRLDFRVVKYEFIGSAGEAMAAKAAAAALAERWGRCMSTRGIRRGRKCELPTPAAPPLLSDYHIPKIKPLVVVSLHVDFRFLGEGGGIGARTALRSATSWWWRRRCCCCCCRG